MLLLYHLFLDGAQLNIAFDCLLGIPLVLKRKGYFLTSSSGWAEPMSAQIRFLNQFQLRGPVKAGALDPHPSQQIEKFMLD